MRRYERGETTMSVIGAVVALAVAAVILGAPAGAAGLGIVCISLGLVLSPAEWRARCMGRLGWHRMERDERGQTPYEVLFVATVIPLVIGLVIVVVVRSLWSPGVWAAVIALSCISVGWSMWRMRQDTAAANLRRVRSDQRGQTREYVVVAVVVVILTAGLIWVLANAAWGDEGEGYWDGTNLGAHVGGGDQGSGSSEGGPVDDGGSYAGPADHDPLQWQRTYYTPSSPGPGAPGGVCIKYPDGSEGIALAEAPAVEGAEYGRWYQDDLVNTDTGEVVVDGRSRRACEYPSHPEPLPPAPPTAAEARDATPLPAPEWGVSPVGDGLTGLATLLWDPTGGAGRDVTATVRGYTVTTHAEPVSWRWTMAASGEPGPASLTNPNPVVTASRPGSADDPAGDYTYQTAGDYTLTLRVTWSGTYTFSGNGVPARTVPLGTITRTSERSYHVAQLRPVLEGLGT